MILFIYLMMCVSQIVNLRYIPREILNRLRLKRISDIYGLPFISFIIVLVSKINWMCSMTWFLCPFALGHIVRWPIWCLDFIILYCLSLLRVTLSARGFDALGVLRTSWRKFRKRVNQALRVAYSRFFGRHLYVAKLFRKLWLGNLFVITILSVFSAEAFNPHFTSLDITTPTALNLIPLEFTFLVYECISGGL